MLFVMDNPKMADVGVRDEELPDINAGIRDADRNYLRLMLAVRVYEYRDDAEADGAEPVSLEHLVAYYQYCQDEHSDIPGKVLGVFSEFRCFPLQ